MRGVASPRWHWRRCRNQDRELPEVLGGGGKVELVSSPIRTAQSEPIELQDALEVCEQHLDLFALAPRGLIGLGLGDLAGQIARPS
jgi:hypothetical protein